MAKEKTAQVTPIAMRLLALSLVGIVFSACASMMTTDENARVTKVIPLSETPEAPKKAPCPLKLFTTQDSNLRYVELCLITGSNENLDRIISDMKKDACECGANALIIKEAKTPVLTHGYNVNGENSTESDIHIPAQASGVAVKLR